MLPIVGQVVPPAPEVTPAPGSDLARLGEERVRRLVTTFMERVFSDAMIGAHFAGKPLGRIRELECRYALQHLGGGEVYSGRPLEVVHRPLELFGGHFDRRRELLREVLAEDGVPEDIAARWLAHTDAQRHLIVGGPCR